MKRPFAPNGMQPARIPTTLPFLSVVILGNLAAAVAVLFPAVAAVVAANPVYCVEGLAIGNMVARCFTRTRIAV